MTVRKIKIKGEQVSFLAHADSAEQLITGTATGETPTGWNLKVKGTYLYWVDDDGAERRKEGTLTGGSRPKGDIIVHGEYIYFGDDDGAERYVYGIHGATLHGTLDDDGGEACDCGFEYGEDTGYGTTTATQSKTTGQTFSQAITELKPLTTYHFRAIATNSIGTSYGSDATFTTF